MARHSMLGPIENGTSYPLDEFQRRTGLGAFALREAKKRGLRTIKAGARVFVRGDDFNTYLDQLAASGSVSDGDRA